jgi:uncharacterized damage-inducible protein DinB
MRPNRGSDEGGKPYNHHWATHRILATCNRISTEQFTHEVNPNPGWGSVRAILAHLLDTDYGWRLVLQARNATAMLTATDFADVAALRARWELEQAAWLEFVDSLSEERLNAGYGADPARSPKVWQTILHVVNHGTQHRSEAATILTGFGHSPGELDFDLFLTDHPEYMQS